jgi:long-subunit acyl-CoA synthetase (AMP-forming)
MVGGTAMSSEQILKLSTVLPHTQIIFIYGLSEIGLASFNRPEDGQQVRQNKLGSCGTLTFGCSLKVLFPFTFSSRYYNAVLDSGS